MILFLSLKYLKKAEDAVIPGDWYQLKAHWLISIGPKWFLLGICEIPLSSRKLLKQTSSSVGLSKEENPGYDSRCFQIVSCLQDW